jgi:c-di-GMP-binding flagellar brake protein YcgR
MATLQHLTIRQIDEVIRSACQRQMPATITVRTAGRWSNLHARMVGVRDGHLLLELAQPEGDGRVHEFQPADRAGISFKLKHHKHIFTATVAAVEAGRCADGTDVRVLQACIPTKMLRMQRRAFLRAAVPANRVVRASYWVGGREFEPTSGSEDQPVWSGRVMDISAGGFQMTSADGGNDALEIGETVGVRISFGAGEETVYADAQFRHRQETDGDIHLGFQFVGLAQTPEGRRALQQIGGRAAQFHRETSAAQRGKRSQPGPKTRQHVS